MKVTFKTTFSILFLTFFLLLLVFQSGLIPAPFLNQMPLLVTVFISIIIQAFPFVLIGVFGSALMHKFITVEMIENKLARTGKLPGILLAIRSGLFFPVCDCGVIPVVRRLLVKKVPPYMAVAFLVTAPLVNPITIWATATAFGYNLPVTLIRVGMAVVVGIIAALFASKFLPSVEYLISPKVLQELETGSSHHSHDCSANDPAVHSIAKTQHDSKKRNEPVIAGIFHHANEEFLEVGKFLVIGAFIAAVMQTFIPRQSLLAITQNPALSVLIMMVLALSMSLCAEADAFVARSFMYHFSLGGVMSFMVFGQMIDFKNAAFLLKSFKPRAVFQIFGLCAILVFIFCCLLDLLPVQNMLWRKF